MTHLSLVKTTYSTTQTESRRGLGHSSSNASTPTRPQPPEPPPLPTKPYPKSPPPPLSPEQGYVCGNGCAFAGDGKCDDGGLGSEFDGCGEGTDCADCGPRDTISTDEEGEVPPHEEEEEIEFNFRPESGLCLHNCVVDGSNHERDGVCDDGGPGSQTSKCELGNDCEDCRDRFLEDFEWYVATRNPGSTAPPPSPHFIAPPPSPGCIDPENAYMGNALFYFLGVVSGVAATVILGKRIWQPRRSAPVGIEPTRTRTAPPSARYAPGTAETAGTELPTVVGVRVRVENTATTTATP